VEIDDIISYHDLVTEEKAALQKGMNYGAGKKCSVFLMSLREGAPYADALDQLLGCSRMKATMNRSGVAGPIQKPLISR
jgi:hypothetical protein